jgi:hypothetical protein
MFDDFRNVLVLLHQFIHQTGHRHARDVALQLAYLLPHFTRPFRGRAHHLLQALGQAGDVVMELALLFLGKFLELLGAQGFALAHGNEGDAGGCLDDADISFARLLFHLLEGFFLGFLEFLGDAFPLGLEVFALEGRRDGGLGVGDDLLDVLAQLAAATRRQCQGPRLPRILEVVHVAPVRRHRQLSRLLFQVPQRKQMTAGTGRSQHEHVVAVDIDFGGELNGFKRPLLTGNLAEFLEFRGGREAQSCRIARAEQCVGRERFAWLDIHHIAFKSLVPSGRFYADTARTGNEQANRGCQTHVRSNRLKYWIRGHSPVPQHPRLHHGPNR